MEYKIRGSNLKKDFLKEIFENRGISQEDIMKYLHPSFNNIQDWRALDNIEDACHLLKKHIDNNSKIVINNVKSTGLFTKLEKLFSFFFFAISNLIPPSGAIGDGSFF